MGDTLGSIIVVILIIVMIVGATWDFINGFKPPSYVTNAEDMKKKLRPSTVPLAGKHWKG